MKRVIGIGNALVDVICFLNNDQLLSALSLPKGSMQLVKSDTVQQIEYLTENLEKHMASGGSAANTIHGLARMGIETAFIGTIGKDIMGGFFKNDLITAGIKPVLLESKLITGQANSLVSLNGERTFATFLGAAIELRAEDLSSAFFTDYNLFHIEGYLVQNHDLVEKALQMALDNNLTVSLDLASYNVVEANLDFLKNMIIKYVDIVFANEDEAKAFTKGKKPFEALDEIAELTEIAVVKIGEKGSLIKTNNKVYQVGIIDADCVDTTGAGDLYAAGFLYGFLNEYNPEKCGKIGALLAGKVIEEPGAKISKLGWDFIYHELKNI